MRTRFTAPLVAIVTLGLALSATGCTRKVVVVEAKAPPAPACPAVVKEDPPPPPAPAPMAEKLTLPGELEFTPGSARIRPTTDSMETLTALLKVMKDNPQITKLRIEGHTDSIGYAAYNQRLSERRADAVAKWLVDHDVDGARIVTVGYGQTHPMVNNDSIDHRKMNRRTEFHIQEMDGKPYTDDTTSSSPTASSAGANHTSI